MTSSPYEIVFKKSALKEFQSLPRQVQIRVLDACQLLAINPYTDLLSIKKLRASDSLYRLRLGDYRIVYSVEGKVLKVIVIKIGHRREVYR